MAVPFKESETLGRQKRIIWGKCETNCIGVTEKNNVVPAKAPVAYTEGKANFAKSTAVTDRHGARAGAKQGDAQKPAGRTSTTVPTSSMYLLLPALSTTRSGQVLQ